MKKMKLLLALMLALPLGLKAQNIQITKFERNYTSLIARMNPVMDNAGEKCAVIRFYMRGTGYIIEPAQGMLKDSVMTGEVRMWVPKGTKRITIRHKDYMPLIGYDIPVRLESECDYDAWIEIRSQESGDKESGDRSQESGDRSQESGNRSQESGVSRQVSASPHFLIGAGFNIVSMSGPSAAIGVDFNHHQIELGGVYGLGKTDRLYFYDNSRNLKASYQYQALRGQLRYGYQMDLGNSLSLTPQVGCAINAYSGVDGEKDTEDYKKASSVSAFGALRLSLALDKKKTIRLQVTGEYDFGVYKSEMYKLISEYDDTFKSWTDGINLNVGFMISI